MKMKQNYKTGFKLLAVAVVGGVIAYRLFFSPVSVESVKVISGPIVAEVMGTGTLEAHVRATISPKISGRISQIFVDQGDKVVKGQKLVTLDDEDLRQQVEMAKAELSVAKAGVEMAVSQINRQRCPLTDNQSWCPPAP
jgi:HlyD family secretion protein